MKRLIPIFVTVVVACAFSADAVAREKERSKKRSSAKKQRVEQRVERIREVPVVETRVQETYIQTPTRPNVVALPTASSLVGERTPAGADTTGVARSTGGGIGEASTRSDVGTGRGGAGIVRSGTLAPSSVRTDTTTITTTVPAVTTTTAEGVVIAPAIPRATTNTGTLGAGTSTPVGVAPGR